MKRAIQAAWLLLSALALGWWWYLEARAPNSDAEVVLAVVVNILSFPLGLVTNAIFGWAVLGLQETTGHTWNHQTALASSVLYWAAMATTGFFQWFWLVPRLTRHLKMWWLKDE